MQLAFDDRKATVNDDISVRSVILHLYIMSNQETPSLLGAHVQYVKGAVEVSIDRAQLMNRRPSVMSPGPPPGLNPAPPTNKPVSKG